MGGFCNFFIDTGHYSVYPKCKVSNDICPQCRWCRNEMIWKPLNGMDGCLLAEEKEIKTNIVFVKNNKIYVKSVPHYDFAGYFSVGEKYRLRAKSDSDTTVSLKTVALSNGVNMPAIRLSITA